MAPKNSEKPTKGGKWFLFFLLMLFIGLIIYEVNCSDIHVHPLISNIILAITALIILWYTIETYEIRKANLIIADANYKNLYRMQRPIVGYNLFMNKERPAFTFFQLINQSNYPVSALIKLIFKIDNSAVNNIWPPYNGKEYWNLQYGQSITGNFCWIELYSTLLSYNDNKINELKGSNFEQVQKIIYEDLTNFADLTFKPKLTMDIEIYSINELQQSIYYPSQHYEFDFFGLSWILTATSEKPYWEYAIKPGWLQNIQSA